MWDLCKSVLHIIQLLIFLLNSGANIMFFTLISKTIASYLRHRRHSSFNPRQLVSSLTFSEGLCDVRHYDKGEITISSMRHEAAFTDVARERGTERKSERERQSGRKWERVTEREKEREKHSYCLRLSTFKTWILSSSSYQCLSSEWTVSSLLINQRRLKKHRKQKPSLFTFCFVSSPICAQLSLPRTRIQKPRIIELPRWSSEPAADNRGKKRRKRRRRIGKINLSHHLLICLA